MRATRNQKGQTLIAVLFILLFIGALGFALTQLTRNQQTDAVQTMETQVAWLTAKSGIEWSYGRMLGGAVVTDLPGTQTLPNGESFVIAYDAATDTLTATAVECSLAGRSGIYDVEVSDQEGRRIALFRGRSRSIAGEVVRVPQGAASVSNPPGQE